MLVCTCTCMCVHLYTYIMYVCVVCGAYWLGCWAHDCNVMGSFPRQGSFVSLSRALHFMFHFTQPKMSTSWLLVQLSLPPWCSTESRMGRLREYLFLPVATQVPWTVCVSMVHASLSQSLIGDGLRFCICKQRERDVHEREREMFIRVCVCAYILTICWRTFGTLKNTHLHSHINMYFTFYLNLWLSELLPKNSHLIRSFKKKLLLIFNFFFFFSCIYYFYCLNSDVDQFWNVGLVDLLFQKN